MMGDRGLSKLPTSDDEDLERRMYGLGGGLCCSVGDVTSLTGEVGEVRPTPVTSSKPSCNARGGGRSTMASRSYI